MTDRKDAWITNGVFVTKYLKQDEKTVYIVHLTDIGERLLNLCAANGWKLEVASSGTRI